MTPEEWDYSKRHGMAHVQRFANFTEPEMGALVGFMEEAVQRQERGALVGR